MLRERVQDIRHSRKREKPTLADCVGILDEAASLPPPEQAPGGAPRMYLRAPAPVGFDMLQCVPKFNASAVQTC